MANFMEDLWNSIFTPGPTPTLLVATNVTFAALQIVLLALLAATYSVHFLVLSILCGGLWISINWFAIELSKGNEEAARLKEKEEAERIKRSIGSDDSGTETEGGPAARTRGGLKPQAQATGKEEEEELTRRRSHTDQESTDSEWDKVESEVDG